MTATVQEVGLTAEISTGGQNLPPQALAPEMLVLDIIRELCQALAAANINYCHWKSNNALDRSANGKNDLDLLVGRADLGRFIEILSRLGFKQARAPAVKQVPGVFDYLGYDPASDRFVHVHAHDQLVLGHDMSKNYRLPIEIPYLESSVQDGLFRVPAPEYEYIVLVIRMMLKHSTWDVILGGEGRLKSAERAEMAYLQARNDPLRIEQILQHHLPYIGVELFNDFLAALEPDSSLQRRIRTGRRLIQSLESNARLPWSQDFLLKIWRRTALAFRRRILKTAPKFKLEHGGAMIAILGGDGAGKSTAVDGLYQWLKKDFEVVRVHMGKPRWSIATVALRGVLKVGSRLGLFAPAVGYREAVQHRALLPAEGAWMLRQISTARDRFHTYLAARRFAAHGGLVLLDRFPHPELQFMDGPQGRQWIGPEKTSRRVRRLIEREESYYAQMVVPELSILLLVPPEVAVERKTDEKPAYVLERSRQIWGRNWDQSGIHIIEASMTKAEVLAAIKALVWGQL